MIKRIVKLSVRPEEVENFQVIFEESKTNIRGFEGCQHLELLRCTDPDNIFFTYSFWNNEEALDAYRKSDLFKRTWSKTKLLFNDKPEAWSVKVDG